MAESQNIKMLCICVHLLSEKNLNPVLEIFTLPNYLIIQRGACIRKYSVKQKILVVSKRQISPRNTANKMRASSNFL